MRNKTLGFGCCILLLMASCATIRNLREVRSTQYLQKMSNIHYADISSQTKPIRTDGYYARVERDKNMVPGYDKVFVFYEDGSCAHLLIHLDEQPTEKVNLGNAVSEAAPLSNNGNFLGVYKISHDTIYANLYRKDLFGPEIIRCYFRIMDDETILCFREEDPQQVYNGMMAYWETEMIFKYVAAENIPLPLDHFLKKRKWIWQNESDWEKYMKSYKKK